jgi:hypothetical protein
LSFGITNCVFINRRNIKYVPAQYCLTERKVTDVSEELSSYFMITFITLTVIPQICRCIEENVGRATPLSAARHVERATPLSAARLHGGDDEMAGE